MNEMIVLLTGSTIVLTTLWMIVGITRYDLRNIRAQAQQARHPRAHQYRRRPTITAILYIDDDTSWWQAALMTLHASRYRKLETILVFPPSLSHTVKQASSALRSRKSVYLYENRHDSFMVAAQKAYRQFGHGDLITTFDSENLPSPNLIPSTVAFFNQHPDVVTLRTRTATVSSFRLLGLLQRYHEFIDDIRRRALSGLNITPVAAKSGGHIYHRSHPTLSGSPTPTYSAYSSEIVMQALPVASTLSLLQRSLHERRLHLRTIKMHIAYPATPLERIASICLLIGQVGVTTLPLLVGYVIFMAVKLHQPIFLSITLAVYLSVLLFAIWKSEDLQLRQKLHYAVLAPITLVPTYLLSFLTPIALAYELMGLHFIPMIRRAREMS